jgi:hypothetical protein
MAEGLKELLDRAGRREFTSDYGDGENRFRVRLRACSRSDIERMRKKAVVQKFDRGSRQYRDEVDFTRLRAWMRDRCIVGWDDLTFRKALRLCNANVENVNGAGVSLDDDMPFDHQHVNLLLEEAIGFDDFVWREVTEIAEQRGEAEDEEKKT